MSLLKHLGLTPPKNAASRAVPPSHAAAERVAAPTGAHHAASGDVKSPAPGRQQAAAVHAASTKGAPDFDNYAALFNGINYLVMDWKHPKDKVDVSPSDDSDLLPKHRRLLNELQKAVALVRPAPERALAGWERISSELGTEVGKSAAAGIENGAIANTRGQLDYIEKQVFVPGAYQAAKRDAKAYSDLTSPDLAAMAPKLAKAEMELGEAKDLWEEALKVGGGAGASPKGGEAPGTVKEIIELVQLPGTIEDKLAQARKRGLATTGIELVAKVGSATGTLLKLVGETGEAFFDARKAIVLARGASKATEEAVKGLEKAAGKFKKLAGAAKSIGRGAGYAAVIADGVRLIAALRDGDYSAFSDAAVDMLQDAAPLAFGEDLAGPLAIGIIAVKADLEAIKLAAAFIRWCKDEMVRQAALDFVAACDVIANGAARDLVADCDLFINASSPKLQDQALKQANLEAAKVSKALRDLSSHVNTTSKQAIGGYPPVVAALGGEAMTAMTVAFNDKDGALLVAQQIDQVFKGANAMAKYVGENYKN